MRTSWLPLSLMFVVTLAVVAMLPWSDNTGIDGPQVEAGIYPLGEPFVAGVDLAELQISGDWQPTEDPVAPAPARDRRVGLEVVPWDRIAIVLEDRLEPTRALAKALAEHFTGYMQEHGRASPVTSQTAAGLVLMAPLDARPVPLAARRILRVRTADYDLPQRPDEEMRCRLVIGLHDAHRDLVQDALGILPVDGIAEGAWEIDCTVRFQGASEPAWTDWYVGWSRRLAADAIRAMGAGGDRPVAWDTPADRGLAVISRQHAAPRDRDPALPERFAWQDTIPWPPGHRVERLLAAFQAPLCRGWTGRILGFEGKHRGAAGATIDFLDDKLTRAGWQRDPERDDRVVWRHGSGAYSRVLARRSDTGWEVVSAMLHPQWRDAIQLWINQIEESPVARNALRRHLRAPLIDDDLRSRMVAALRAADPDLAEQAQLGALPAATPIEGRVHHLVAWLRGLQEVPPSIWPESGVDLSAGPLTAWRGEPQVLRSADHWLIVAADPYRWTVWSRRLDAAAQHASAALVDGAVVEVDGQRLRLTAGAAGAWRIVAATSETAP